MARATRQILDFALGVSKSAKKFGATSWKYLKVEAVPPFTVGFFNGPAGRKLENFADKMANGFIGALEGRIKEIDAEAEAKRLEILAAIKAHEEKVKAELKKKEAERIKAAAMKAAEEIKKAAALAEKKKVEAEAARAKEKPKEKTKEPKRKKPKGKSKSRPKNTKKTKPRKKGK